jgi:CBS domain containing-hemolysin-like protein
MMTIILNCAIIVFCVLLQAFFSGSEMVILSANKMKLRRLSQKGAKGARLALSIIDKPRWFLATTTTGTNVAVIIASATAAVWMETIYGEHGELATILIISPFLLMFGEILPRTVFQRRATRLAPKIAPILFVMSKIIFPLTLLVFGISRIFYRRVGKENIEGETLITREELELLISNSTKGSDVKVREKKLIHRVFHLTDTEVSEAMVPLVNVKAISDASTAQQVIKLINQTGFSRIPVYHERIDNLIGIIHALDILDIVDHQRPVKPFIREVPFVPELKKTGDLLIFLQKSRNSIAIVVDEYGGVAGIITIEDILEEVVGEIRDEYHSERTDIVEITSNQFKVRAGVEIDYLNDRLKIQIPKDNYETLGGFLLKQMGKVPREGESYRFENMGFTIVSSSRRAIHQVIIEIKPEAFID